jgi:hypothetical protein
MSFSFLRHFRNFPSPLTHIRAPLLREYSGLFPNGRIFEMSIE